MLENMSLSGYFSYFIMELITGVTYFALAGFDMIGIQNQSR